MEEIEAKQAALVERLFTLTKTGKIQWFKDDYYGDIRAQLGDHFIVLEQSTDPDGTPFEVIKVNDATNDTIDSFSDASIKDQEMSFQAHFSTFYSMMSTLRIAAERQARNIDKALDNIMLALDELENPKPKKPSFGGGKAFSDDLDDDVPF